MSNGSDGPSGYLRILVSGVPDARFRFRRGTLSFVPQLVGAELAAEAILASDLETITIDPPDIVILLRPNDVERGVFDLDPIVGTLADRGWPIDHVIVAHLEE